MTPAEIAPSFRSWLADHRADLEPFRREHGRTIVETYDHDRDLMHLLFEAGWSRYGWPEEFGGLGGSPVSRGVIHDELTAAGYHLPEAFAALEVIAPMLMKYRPDLAAEQLPAAIRGDEVWCQGFSEPDAGSDLASLRTRAFDEGDHFRIVGQKTWTSNGHFSKRIAVLARTGEPDSAHRGLTMFWVDMDAPGLTVRPIMCANGREEVAEEFFDDVIVSRDRIVGEIGGGWGVVMYLLQFERGNYAWQRQAILHSRVLDTVAAVADDRSSLPPDAPAQVGEAYLDLMALRARSRTTMRTLATGVDLGPEISIDKVMLGATEQRVNDLIAGLTWPSQELGDDEEAWTRRHLWWYSRITTIYGGAAEVQRDLVAQRVLGLPRSS
ncbi:MAG: acyl-CoA dehydrogenase family protein [Acidimicrobiia bacterium]